MSGEVLLTELKPDTLFRALIVAALLFGLLCGVLLAFLVPLLGAAIVLATVCTIAAMALVSHWRLNQQEVTLWALALASERGMPLASALGALAGGHDDTANRCLRALANLLNAGAPLTEAMDLVPGVLPRDASALLRVGWAFDCLPGVLREVAESRASRRPLRSAIASRIGYLLVVLATMQVIVSFLIYFISPKYEAICHDFGIPLPKLTIFVVQVSHAVMSWAAPALALLVLAELLLLLSMPLILTGWWDWNSPIVDRLFLRKHTATILRALAWVVDAGKPLSLGVANLARGYLSHWIRGRLEGVLQDLVEGVDCWDALEARGLIHPAEAALLESARRAGNLSWALREAAEAAERRFDYRLQAGLQLFSVLVLLGLGALVLLLATAYYSPLITIIETLV